MRLVAIGHSLKAIGYGNFELQEQFKDEIKKFLSVHSPDLVFVLPIPGFGLWIAEECYRGRYPYILVQPFKGHDEPWPPYVKRLYKRLQRGSIKVINSDRRVGYQDTYGQPDKFAQNKILKATRWACDQMKNNDMLLTTELPQRQEWVIMAPELVLHKPPPRVLDWQHHVISYVSNELPLSIRTQVYEDLPF